jgi:hypothetical protein
MEYKLREFKTSDRDCEITPRDSKAKEKDRKPEEAAVDVGIDCIGEMLCDERFVKTIIKYVEVN